MTEDKYDKIEVDGEKCAVIFDDNSIPNSVDAVVADYEDRFFLENEREQTGTAYVLDKSEVENGDPLEVVRDRVLESKTEESSDLEMEGIDAL